MNPRSLLSLFGLLLLVALSAISSAQDFDQHSYLPIVAKPALPPDTMTIRGQVTENGAMVGGIAIELRAARGGGTLVTYATTTTGSDGRFVFAEIPWPQAADRYYVRYRNSAKAPGRLLLWTTAAIRADNASRELDLSPFDIADVQLQAPGADETITLPSTFRWAPRPATPTDNYAINIWDSNDENPSLYLESLGYTGSFTLEPYHADFTGSTDFVWTVQVRRDDGGNGIARELRAVKIAGQ